MRRIAFGEWSLGANMVIMVLDGIPLNLEVLMGKFVEIHPQRMGKILSSFFSFEVGASSSIFFGTIVGVRRVLYGIFSPLFMCLL